jgi:sugar lactone lactonase YvrE
MKIISKSEIECVHNERAQLGESPVWSEAHNCLYWIDIEGYTFNSFDPNKGYNHSKDTAIRFGSFALREDDSFVVATEFGFQLYHFHKNSLTPLTNPESNKPNNRFNDGRCDRAGRFWAGTMVEKGPPINDASLYSLNKNLNCKKKYTGFGLANGLAWSPDNKIMYFADTRLPVVWAFDFNLASGDIFNKRVFIEFGNEDGVPDGATIDVDGCYWLTQPRAAKICRYTPRGKVDTVIRLPVTKPTMCAFGGPSLKTLYVTTSSFGLSEAEMAIQPLAGSLLAIELQTQGIPEPRFIG